VIEMTTWLGVRQTPARLPRLTVAAALGEPTGTPPLLPANPHTAARTHPAQPFVAYNAVDAVCQPRTPRARRLIATGVFRLCGGSDLRRVRVTSSLTHSA